MKLSEFIAELQEAKKGNGVADPELTIELDYPDRVTYRLIGVIGSGELHNPPLILVGRLGRRVQR